jgi:Domain of unknown function (DUF4375)
MDTIGAVDFTNEVWAKVGYNRSALPATIQTVHLIGWLSYEVALGSAYGWLINMGEYGPATVDALETVGAHQCASIVREILAFFPNGKPAFDCRERVRQMEEIGEAGETRWSGLGDRLLTWPDDIDTLLQQFINEHEADFT